VLRAPAERLESARPIIGLGRDTALDQHPGAAPAQRPSLRVEGGLQYTLSQHLQQGLLWPAGQAWRTARRWSSPQTLKVTLASPKLLGPEADRRATDTHLTRDGGVGKTPSLQQPPGLQTAFRKLCAGELSWSP
jgi:hypothetical protein